MSILESNNSSVEQILEREGVFASVTVGTSMRPLFKTRRDMVILKKPEQPPRKYDVVLYKIKKKYVLHRIVKVKKGEYVMCGDNQFDLEYGITDKHILAKMKSFIRDEQTIDDTNKKYRRYIKRLPCRRFRKRLRNLLGRIKRKIFKKKTA